MTFLQKIRVIERVDALIRRKSTGTASDLARRLGVSRRSVYDILELMKKMDAPIEYCPTRKSYYYSYQCDLSIGFVNRNRLRGGTCNIYRHFFSSANYLHNSTLNLDYDDRKAADYYTI